MCFAKPALEKSVPEKSTNTFGAPRVPPHKTSPHGGKIFPKGPRGFLGASVVGRVGGIRRALRNFVNFLPGNGWVVVGLRLGAGKKKLLPPEWSCYPGHCCKKRKKGKKNKKQNRLFTGGDFFCDFGPVFLLRFGASRFSVGGPVWGAGGGNKTKKVFGGRSFGKKKNRFSLVTQFGSGYGRFGSTFLSRAAAGWGPPNGVWQLPEVALWVGGGNRGHRRAD